MRELEINFAKNLDNIEYFKAKEIILIPPFIIQGMLYIKFIDKESPFHIDFLRKFKHIDAKLSSLT